MNSSESSKIHMNDIIKSLQNFSQLDYGIFILMLVMSSFIGLYFGYKDHKKHKKDLQGTKSDTEATDYLVGGRKMQAFPVAMSLIASWVSGISLLGLSTEVYLYGFQYSLIILAIGLMTIFVYFITIPIFNELKITSAYEYLEARFDKRVRSLCSILYSVSLMLYMTIVIYVPALAFNQVTGIGVHIISPIVCLVCIFYTLMGGIKAVIWSDVFQITIMFGTVLLIAVKGTNDVGGLTEVLKINLENERIEIPQFHIDPTIRHTFWTILLGGTCFWINTNTGEQAFVQRFLSLSSTKTARQALLIYSAGVSILILLCCYNGLLIYATYHNCDPLQTKLAKAQDQILPLLVMDILRDFPGLRGLFVAGVFSAALSSLSTGLNSMAAIVLEDFFKSFTKRKFSERETSIIMRGTVFVVGALCTGMVYVVQHLGSVLQLAMSVPTACIAPILGVFLLGMFAPWINAKGAFYGLICSFLSMGYIILKSQTDIAIGNISFETKPLSVSNCTYEFEVIENPIVHTINENGKSLHNMSYLYYTAFGSCVSCLIAVAYCAFTEFQDPSTVDQKLLAPFIRKYTKSQNIKNVNKQYTAVPINEERK